MSLIPLPTDPTNINGKSSGFGIGVGLFSDLANLRQFTQLTAAQLLRLGNVIFHGFECPNRLTNSYTQRHVIQEFVGGGRSVQAFGTQPGPIRWAGKLVPQHEFYNAQTGEKYSAQLNAIKRMLDLQYMHDRGQPVELVFGKLRWNVLIASFESDIVNVNEVNYAIELVVIEDYTVDKLGLLSFDTPYQLSGESNEILSALRTVLNLAQSIIRTVEENQLYAFIGLELASAIESGNEELALLAGLIASDTALAALGSQVSLINIANIMAEKATIIKLFADELQDLF